MIQYSYEEINWELELAEDVTDWLTTLATHHGRTIQQLAYIFTNDEHLRYLNDKYLQHDYFTDILTFDYSDGAKKPIVGDIFISIDRVKENSQTLNQPFIDELHRVMAHGLLHILGYDDTNEKVTAEMRQQEEFALNLRMF
jgi:probable rRNA maturation factor